MLLGGGTGLHGSGLSLDPWKAMSKYEQTAVRRMKDQIKDMKEVEKDYWQESYFEKDIPQDITKKPEDC